MKALVLGILRASSTNGWNMETYIKIDVYFDEEGQYKYQAERIFDVLSPLSDHTQEDFEPNLKKALGKFGATNENYRMECLSKMYDQVVVESVKLVSPYHVRLRFFCGSDGFDFAEDFCFAVFQMNATKVAASLGHDEDPNRTQKITFELDREQIFKVE